MASQYNRALDTANEPAYVRIGSESTSFQSPVGVSTADSFRKRGLGDYAYLCGTDLDYLDALSRWQGDWGMTPMSQDYVDAFAGTDFNGSNSWDWNTFEDQDAAEKKAMLQAIGSMHLID